MSGTVNFVPMVTDAVAVSRASFVRGLKRRRFHVRLILLAIIGTVGGIAFDWLTAQPLTIRDALIGAAAALAWMGILLCLLYILLPRRSRRQFRQQRSLDQSFTFAWNDAGILFKSARSQSDLGWNEYHDWFEAPAVFAFGLNEKLYHWVPKRAMCEAEVADLRATASLHFNT